MLLYKSTVRSLSGKKTDATIDYIIINVQNLFTFRSTGCVFHVFYIGFTAAFYSSKTEVAFSWLHRKLHLIPALS